MRRLAARLRVAAVVRLRVPAVVRLRVAVVRLRVAVVRLRVPAVRLRVPVVVRLRAGARVLGAIRLATASSVVGPMLVGRMAPRVVGPRDMDWATRRRDMWSVGQKKKPLPGKRSSQQCMSGRRHTIRHLGSGKYSDVFRVQPAPGGKSVVMKVSYYRDDTLCNFIKKAKAGDVRGALRAKKLDSIQVSSNFAKVTAGLLDSVSPHFVLVYCDYDCKSFAPRLGVLLKDRLKDLTPFQKRYNNVCFMEVFHDNLTKYLVGHKYDEDALRAIIFQVVYTLAALQRLFPGFRHNDLSTNNVLVKKLRSRPLLSYTFDNATYYAAAPVLVALSDYDFTHVPNHPELSNERVMFGKYKVDGRANDSYDTHFFLKSVMKCIQRRAKEFPRAWDFLTRLRMRQEDRQNGQVFARLKPAAVLQDQYFAPLKQKPAGEVAAAFAA